MRALHPESAESTRTWIGVPAIDQFLEVFRPFSRPQDDNSFGETPTVAEQEPAHIEIPSQPALHTRTGPVLEISSTSSAAGKSQTLYYLVALTVLPHEFEGISVGGFGSAAVFLDNDGRFDAERLRVIARGIVQDKLVREGEPPSGISVHESIGAMLYASLQHVHVFRPQSSPALLATIQSLDAYLFDLSRHTSVDRPLRAICIDSATAFFWQDKLQDEIARTEDIGRSVAEIERERYQKESFHIADLYSDIVTSLKRVQRIFDCNVVYTANSSGKLAERAPLPYGSYNPLDAALSGPSFRSPLPPPWGLFPTLRLVLQREVIRPFPPGVTVEEAQRDAPLRQEVVMRGEFLASVNGWGREDLPRRILEQLRRLRGGQFTFKIGSQGLTFP